MMRCSYLHKSLSTQKGGKIVPAFRVVAENEPSVLLVIYLERLNCIPRVLIGAFSVTTEAVMKDK